MHLINMQYKILDVFEKNPLQNMMLGSAIENPDEIVVINEVMWSPLFTRELAMALFDGFINLKTHSEDESSCQLVTAYHQGMPIGKYLASRSLSFRNRINLCYEFLKAMVSYDGFPPWIQDILIDEDQIIVWEDQLRYNELLILKTSDAEYAGEISFFRVQKKIYKVFAKVIENSEDASPALLSFLERLKGNSDTLGSLQAIYDDFQKVYLYDYYLNQDDSIQPTAAIIPAPPAPEEPETTLEEESVEIPEPEPEPLEDPIVAPPSAEQAEEPTIPVPPLPVEETTAIPTLSELDAVDSDMEQNLELFFNRDRQQSEDPEFSVIAPSRNKNRLWLALGIAALLLVFWAAGHYLLSTGTPVAGYSKTETDGIWHLQNKSTFSEKAPFQRSEWTVYKNGQIIERYDTDDLTLSLEEEGLYQVILRVMDRSGKWSKPYSETLENHLASSAAVLPVAPAVPGDSSAAGENMDAFTFKFAPERTLKDAAFFRSGTFSLKVLPGKTPEIIEVQGILLDKNGMVSLWIASEDAKTVSLTFTGYNEKNKVFSKEFSFKSMAPQQWEMKQFTVESDKLVNNMTLTVKSDTPVYVDDLSIESYK